jgi:hypothetical protein
LDECHHHYHGGYHGSYPAGAGLAVVGAAAVGTAITASAFQAMSCPMTPVAVNGFTYYQCGSTWYQPAYQGSQVTYVVVNPRSYCAVRLTNGTNLQPRGGDS